jgi:SlyX protein
MSLELRITDLETRLAFQDDTIQSLNDELIAQLRLVERLQVQMEALIRRQDELAGQLEAGAGEDEAPPPHY